MSFDEHLLLHQHVRMSNCPSSRSLLAIDCSKNTLDVFDGEQHATLAYEDYKKIVGVQRIVIESTGGYHIKACTFWQKQGIIVFLVNNKGFHDYREQEAKFLKTDKSDSRLLFLYAKAHPSRLVRFRPPTRLHVLKRKYFLLVDLRAKMKNRVEFFKTVGDGENLAYAKELVSIVMAELKDVKNAALLLLRKDLLLKYGFIVTLLLSAHEPSRFSNSKKFVSSLGLVPSIHSSGKLVKRGVMTRQGDARIRKVLYMRALLVVKDHVMPWYGKYERVRENSGGRGKVALVAVMRVLAKHFWKDYQG